MNCPDRSLQTIGPACAKGTAVTGAHRDLKPSHASKDTTMPSYRSVFPSKYLKADDRRRRPAAAGGGGGMTHLKEQQILEELRAELEAAGLRPEFMSIERLTDDGTPLPGRAVARQQPQPADGPVQLDLLEQQS